MIDVSGTTVAVGGSEKIDIWAQYENRTGFSLHRIHLDERVGDDGVEVQQPAVALSKTNEKGEHPLLVVGHGGRVGIYRTVRTTDDN